MSISSEPTAAIGFDDFLKVDIRVGTIVEAAPYPEARKPAIKLVIDFGGTIGLKKSSAQITKHYRPEDLPGRQGLALVKFPPRPIGKDMSEVLTLGVPDDDVVGPVHQVQIAVLVLVAEVAHGHPVPGPRVVVAASRCG